MAEKGTFFILLAIFCNLCFATEPPFAQGVYCGVQNSVLVDIDPSKHRYIPFVTKLPRCAGAIGLHQPSVKKCVKMTYENVSYKVNSVSDFKVNVLTLEKHTSCKSVCVLDKSTCDLRFQNWNTLDCKCDCKYSVAPKLSLCSQPKVWKQNRCSCGCPFSPTNCPDKKEWSEEMCACMCSKRYMNRCAKKNKVVNQESCKCMEPTVKYINRTYATRQTDQQCSRITDGTVVIIVVLEFLFLLCIFILVYRCCLRYDPEIDPNTTNLNRMKYEIRKMRTMTRRKKPEEKLHTKESKTLEPNGLRQESPTLEKLNHQESDDDFQERKDLALSDRDEPVGFYPDGDPYDTCESETFTSQAAQVTAV